FLRILAELRVRAKPAVNDVNVLAGGRVRPERSRSLRFCPDQCHRLLDTEVRGRERRRQRGRVALPAWSQLEEWSVATNTHTNGLTGFRVLVHVDQRIVGA